MSVDKLRNDMLSKLENEFTTEQLQRIALAFDVSSCDYEIQVKCTELVIFEYIPNEVKTYLVSRKIEGLSQATLDGYLLVLKNFFEMVRVRLQDIEPNDIKKYLYDYQEERGISNRSLDHIRSIISAFFEWCTLEDYIQVNPCKGIKKIKYVPKQKEFLTQYELEQVREACLTTRERALVEFFYSTGCRVSEVSNIDKTDINFITKEVKVRVAKGGKHRVCYLNAKAEMWLLKYLEERVDAEPALFVSKNKLKHRLHKDGLEKIIRDIMKRVNITKNVTPHTFRHTTATTATGNGMPIAEVSKYLGHANLAATMIYAEIAASDIKHHHAKCVI